MKYSGHFKFFDNEPNQFYANFVFPAPSHVNVFFLKRKTIKWIRNMFIFKLEFVGGKKICDVIFEGRSDFL